MLLEERYQYISYEQLKKAGELHGSNQWIFFENEKGYQENNLMDKVKNLKGKLLLIHGTDDATVIWQHSIKFLKQAVSDNVQVDYFVYPGYEHNVRGKDRVHLMQKISDYFDDYLK